MVLLLADRLLLGIWSLYEFPVVAVASYSYSVLKTTETRSSGGQGV